MEKVRGYLRLAVDTASLCLFVVALAQMARADNRPLTFRANPQPTLNRLAEVKGVYLIIRQNRITGRPECVLMKHYEDDTESGFTVSSKPNWKDTLSDCGSALDRLEMEVRKAKKGGKP